MKICFIDKTEFQYNFEDINNHIIRGAENVLINLSREISKLGHNVTVFNNCSKEYENKNFSWLNISRLSIGNFNFNIAISNNDTNLLDNILAPKKYVISHSLLTIEKFIRKKQLFSYIKNRPIYLLLSDYHLNKMSKIISLFGTKKIFYGVDKAFQDEPLSDFHDKNLSFFTSRQDRNLDKLINVWKEDIFKKRSDSKLFITPISKDLRKFNIFNRKMLQRDKYIDDIKKSRMIILPGHKSELFCLAALEASELCIPLVTMGIGSLSERVEHGVTGLISNNYSEFSKNILDLYNNDHMWQEIKINLRLRRGNNSWNRAAQNFLKIITI